MAEPKSSATIRALADLAELSAKQLEDGRSVEDVIEILRSAAKTVRFALEPDDDQLSEDLTPVIIDADQEQVDAEDTSVENISA